MQAKETIIDKYIILSTCLSAAIQGQQQLRIATFDLTDLTTRLTLISNFSLKRKLICVGSIVLSFVFSSQILFQVSQARQAPQQTLLEFKKKSQLFARYTPAKSKCIGVGGVAAYPLLHLHLASDRVIYQAKRCWSLQCRSNNNDYKRIHLASMFYSLRKRDRMNSICT